MPKRSASALSEKIRARGQSLMARMGHPASAAAAAAATAAAKAKLPAVGRPALSFDKRVRTNGTAVDAPLAVLELPQQPQQQQQQQQQQGHGSDSEGARQRRGRGRSQPVPGSRTDARDDGDADDDDELEVVLQEQGDTLSSAYVRVSVCFLIMCVCFVVRSPCAFFVCGFIFLFVGAGVC